MASISVYTTRVPVTTYEEEKEYILTLSEDEAAVVLALSGSVAGQGELRDVSNSVYGALVTCDLKDNRFYKNLVYGKKNSISPIEDLNWDSPGSAGGRV